MAIYHLEAKVVSRGTGRSAVAASAYLSCTNILNDYDGVRHDYTRKKGLIWREVFLPEYAPPEWKDRGVLWNAVEENEKTKDSRLAREFVPALPVELTPTQWQELLSDFIKESFRFLYKGIIIKHNKTEPTYTKTSLFLCEKRRFFMARTEKGVVATI